MLSPPDSICCFTSSECHVVSNYKEPGTDGHFDDCTKEVLKGLEDGDSDTDEEVRPLNCCLSSVGIKLLHIIHNM